MQMHDDHVEQILTLINEGTDESALVDRFPNETALVHDLVQFASDFRRERERIRPSEDQLHRLLSSLPPEKQALAPSEETIRGTSRMRAWFSLARALPIGLAVVAAVAIGIFAMQRNGNTPLPIARTNIAPSAETNIAPQNTNVNSQETNTALTNTTNTASNENSASNTAPQQANTDNDPAELLALLSELDAGNTELTADMATVDQGASDADAVLSGVSFEDIGKSLDAVGSS